jgi:tetratricopeptide (TPR) repeat protein
MKKLFAAALLFIFVSGCTPDYQGNIELQSYDKLFDSYKESVIASIEPDSPVSHYHIGNTYLKKLYKAQKKDHEAILNTAIRHYQSCINIDPLFPGAYYGMGVAYIKKNEHDNAIKSLKKALELNPGFADANYLLGNLYEKQGKVNKALKYYSKTLETNPYDVRANVFLGNIYLDQKEYEKALKYFEKALKINPQTDIAKKGIQVATKKIDEQGKKLKKDKKHSEKPAPENIEPSEQPEE